MKIPYHIAIIMDGNGRWAKKKGLPRNIGHREGSKRIREIVEEAKKLGVKAITVFAFSTENWRRPKTELKFLFSYLVKFLNSYKKKLMKEDIKFRVIGRRGRLDKKVLAKIKEIESMTKNNKSFTLNVAIDYGGRWDIADAAKRIAKDYNNKKITEINQKIFGNYLSLAGVGDPDLLIRTSGEERISNFLLWNLAYSEFYFTPVFWPDFNKHQLRKAVGVYSQRQRRFGEIHG